MEIASLSSIDLKDQENINQFSNLRLKMLLVESTHGTRFFWIPIPFAMPIMLRRFSFKFSNIILVETMVRKHRVPLLLET